MARLEPFGEFVIESRQGEVDLSRAAAGEAGEQVNVANDEVGSGMNDNRISGCSQDFEASPGETKLSLDRLVAVGSSRKGDRCGPPAPAGERFLK
jgi:hypothetical protein